MLRRLALAVVIVAGGACGSGSDPTVEADRPLGTTTSSTLPEASFGEFATTPVTFPGTGRGLLQALRTGVHADEGYVRVTFEFDVLPGHRVDYADGPVTQDGSGDEVDVAGDAALLVNFEPASSFDLETSTPTYRGPKRIAIASEAVPEVVFVGDFEAVLSWAVGLDRERPFRVRTLDAPPRVVVDVEA